MPGMMCFVYNTYLIPSTLTPPYRKQIQNARELIRVLVNLHAQKIRHKQDISRNFRRPFGKIRENRPLLSSARELRGSFLVNDPISYVQLNHQGTFMRFDFQPSLSQGHREIIHLAV